MISKPDYDFLSELLLKRSGLSLGEGKEYLLESRLIPLSQSFGLTGLEALVVELRRTAQERLASAVTEAMTTNETLFFRDKAPFDEIQKLLLPPILEARRATRSLRIWCAAASTGQEPYSLVMMLKEGFPELATWKIEIVGTDISTNALARATEGVYSQFEVQRGLPIQYLMKYFSQVTNGWQVKDELRKAVSYRKLNLLEPFSQLGRFDLVLCRNVLIYFEPDNKKLILERIAGMLAPDGYLMLGAAETVMGLTNKFERRRDCRSAVYAQPGMLAAAAH